MLPLGVLPLGGGLLAASCTAALLLLFPPGNAGGAEPDAGGGVFHPAPVLDLEIELSPEAFRRLRDDGRAFARATIREGGAVYTEVGVRRKGSAGSNRDLNDKPAFTLKFNQFVSGLRFHGLKKIHLNNCVQDPSYLSELVGGELFRAAGVPAPRVGHARVRLNGRNLGLYTVVEAVTSEFLGRWFKDSSGNVYEGPQDINSGQLDVDSRGGQGDNAELRPLVEAAGERDLARRWEALEKVLDVERFISFLAMESLTSHWDGYATGVNNYHVYHDPATGRMVFMPHGTDQLFQQPHASVRPRTAGLVARAVLELPLGRRRYRERMEALLRDVFKEEELHARIDEVTARLRPALQEVGRRGREQEEAARQLKQNIVERGRFLRGEIARAPEKPSVEFDGRGVSRLGGWEPKVRSGEVEAVRVPGEGAAGGAALLIRSEGPVRASFRKKVVLAEGRYLFRGQIRTENVEQPGAQGGGGACLRISRSGQEPRLRMEGTEPWRAFRFEFSVTGEEAGEPPLGQAELVCELHARQGTVWFDEGSLELVRLEGPPQPRAQGTD